MKYSDTVSFMSRRALIRQLRINTLLNGWLIENLQPPFTLCVNKDR